MAGYKTSVEDNMELYKVVGADLPGAGTPEGLNRCMVRLSGGGPRGPFGDWPYLKKLKTGAFKLE